MECQEAKNNLSAYLDRELDLQSMKEIEAHLGSCPSCLQESQQMIRSWALLDLAPQIEPSPDYVSRFWTKVAIQESAYERFVRGVKILLGNRRLIPIATTLSLMLIVGSTVLIHQINLRNDLSQIKPDDIEMLQHMDLAEHFETIKDLGVIRDLDSIQKQGAILERVNKMKNWMVYFEFFMLVFAMQLFVDCPAEAQPSPKAVVVSQQAKIDPADVEVIQNLDLLQEWDIVGPQGPDMNKLSILNAKPSTGASHDK